MKTLILNNKTYTIQEISPALAQWEFESRMNNAGKRGGMPSAAVAPLLITFEEGLQLKVYTAYKVVGMIVKPELITEYIAHFQSIYEANYSRGLSAVSKKGTEFLVNYYSEHTKFDLTCFTSIDPIESNSIQNLKKNPECKLVFYEFQIPQKPLRCFEVDCVAELMTEDTDFYKYVYWRNSLFHDRAKHAIVIKYNVLNVFDRTLELNIDNNPDD